MRYKRYSRRYKRSTNVIRMKFQSFMDISTTSNSMQIITISAGGPEILKRLAPQFGAYKYYKIGNISAKLVPASTLPCDPSGLSYSENEPTVDPRDQLTPGMMRITNGEDVFENIAGLTDDQQHGIYNNMLLDPRWFKWMLQSGVKRHATPRYWQIGQLHQDKWPGAFTNMPMIASDDISVQDTCYEGRSRTIGGAEKTFAAQGSTPYGFFQTGHRGVLGWLPTDDLQPVIQADGSKANKPFIASPPEIEVMKIILPKAYKTRYYYRLFISETVLFKEPIVNFGIPAENTYQYRPIDVFHNVAIPEPILPSSSVQDTTVTNQYTGGNYGDD